MLIIRANQPVTSSETMDVLGLLKNTCRTDAPKDVMRGDLDYLGFYNKTCKTDATKDVMRGDLGL